MVNPHTLLAQLKLYRDQPRNLRRFINQVRRLVLNPRRCRHEVILDAADVSMCGLCELPCTEGSAPTFHCMGCCDACLRHGPLSPWLSGLLATQPLKTIDITALAREVVGDGSDEHPGTLGRLYNVRGPSAAALLRERWGPYGAALSYEERGWALLWLLSFGFVGVCRGTGLNAGHLPRFQRNAFNHVQDTFGRIGRVMEVEIYSS